MALRPEPDVTHADWFARRDEHWSDLCTRGPSGFAAYARIFHAGAEVVGDELQDYEGDLERALLLSLTSVLARHTTTPDDCFFALWAGWGDISDELLGMPRVRIPARDYLLFRGALEDAGLWVPGEDRSMSNSPNLMCPADRSWFVATEVDQVWTGIGGSEGLVADVLAEPGLRVSRA